MLNKLDIMFELASGDNELFDFSNFTTNELYNLATLLDEVFNGNNNIEDIKIN